MNLYANDDSPRTAFLMNEDPSPLIIITTIFHLIAIILLLLLFCHTAYANSNVYSFGRTSDKYRNA